MDTLVFQESQGKKEIQVYQEIMEPLVWMDLEDFQE